MDALALAVAAALLVVGAAALVVRRWRPAAAAIAVGLAMPAIAFTDAGFAAPSTVALATLALPAVTSMAGWGCTRTRVAVAVALVAGLVAGPLRTLVYDPYYDLTCLTRCLPNPLAVTPLGHGMTTALLAAGLLVPPALTWAAVTGPDRLPLGLLAAASWGIAVSGDRDVEAAALTGVVLLVHVGLEVARAFDARARIADLAQALRAAGDVEETLRQLVSDPRLAVAYWLQEEDSFVDPAGRHTSGTSDGLLATDIRGPEGLEARFLHTPGTDAAAIADAVDGSARIALENGRLSARVRSQARRLEASRRRIVTDADAERRRLERDLHDGAQQHVLALGVEIRRAMDSAADPEERALLGSSLAATQLVLDELRELSHGFYPSSLDQAGLRNALDGVSDQSPVPMSVRSIPDERLPAEVERAVYLLVARVAGAGTEPLEVSVTCSETEVDVVIWGARHPQGVLPDVFAVLGGTLMSTDEGKVPAVRARIPLTPRTEAPQ
jgi:signal transduction histidine kinase